MTERKRGYLKISKAWGECECGCGRIIKPPCLMCIVEGFFYIATHEKKHEMLFGENQSSLTIKEADMPTPKKKVAKKAAEKKSAPVAKKVAAKKTPAPATKKAAPVKDTEPKAPRLTANSLCRQLLLERQFTDEQILEQVKKVFPDSKFTKSYISTTRVDLNKGVYKNETVETPIQKLVEHEGSVVPYEDVKKAREEAEAARKAQKKAEKKTPAAPPAAAKKKLPIKK